MQLNKAELLAKIDAYYVEEARRRIRRYEAQRELWSEWQVERLKCKTAQEDVLWTLYQELRGRPDTFGAGGYTEKVLEKALKPYYDTQQPSYDTNPGSFYNRARVLFNSTTIPKDEPELILEENVLEGLRGNGRFSPLKAMLENAVADKTVSVSALTRLGVLSTEDARILWGS